MNRILTDKKPTSKVVTEQVGLGAFLGFGSFPFLVLFSPVAGNHVSFGQFNSHAIVLNST